MTKPSLNSVFELTRQENDELLARIDALLALKKNISEPEKAELKALYGEISNRQEFILVEPGDTHAYLHGELFDRVHPLDLGTRLGAQDQSKQTYALAVKAGDARYRSTAVVYTFWSADKILPGKINDVLGAPPRPLDAQVRYVVPYSVSSIFPGAGGQLLDRLHGHVYSRDDAPRLTTLSPLRDEKTGLKDWMESHGISAEPRYSDRDLRYFALSYLFSKADSVQQFHQNRGARIEAIHTGNSASASDMERALGVMTSYYYPPDLQKIARYKDQFQSAVLPPPCSRAIRAEAEALGLVRPPEPAPDAEGAEHRF